jgi:hypothetical protein
VRKALGPADPASEEVVDGIFGTLLASEAAHWAEFTMGDLRNEPKSGTRRRPLSTGCVGWLVALLGCSGCGNTLYSIHANAASSRLEEARELGAEKFAPYEYYFAKEHLQKAQEEAAEADYSDAADLAEVCEEYAEKAIRLSRDAHRGLGR